MGGDAIFSRHALLKRAGLPPSKKLLIFFISAGLLTIPLPHVYNSLTLILFVAYTLLSYNKENVKLRPVLMPLLAFFALMVISAIWSEDIKATFKALGRESALLFIPVAFCLNMQLSKRGVRKILNNYSLMIFLFAVFLMVKAVFRYSNTGNTEVFFYHELATKDISAVYLSVMVAMAAFHFLCKKNKTFWGYLTLLFLMVFLFLLSSKIIILTSVLLVAAYYVFYSGMGRQFKIIALLVFFGMAGVLGYYGKISERLATEFQYNSIDNNSAEIHHVSFDEAWNRETFTANDYLTGTTIRVYQARIFNEMLKEDNIFLTGYGLDASSLHIERKGVEHNLIHTGEGGITYNKINFHNQYIESFADLGIFGLLIVVVLLVVNLKNSIKNKEFIHIAFAVLMISLFLTESFLWRQRGVVFFTMFYCLFNTGLLPVNKNNRAL
ncbi:O-antigen ligase family protein [Flavobacterium coralii]|uniref:O-antigen ligase family protein n=1 Tax=Flavobacterium coralii TaxID=2838017 RepID=UPI0032B287DC|tara:strand:- start:44802 stop:46118 length:1317 start_codon:yes stop_codon:yes gene_type:complete